MKRQEDRLLDGKKHAHSHSLLQLEQVASHTRNKAQAPQHRYCVKPILQAIPSLAVRWPPVENDPGSLNAADHPSALQNHNSLGEGATMIDLQVSGTFERNGGRRAKKFAEDADSSSSSGSKRGLGMKNPRRKNKRRGDSSSSAASTVLPVEEISDKTGFLLRKQLHMKKKLDL